MTIYVCDRCKKQCVVGQPIFSVFTATATVQVKRAEICDACVRDLLEWLKPIPVIPLPHA